MTWIYNNWQFQKSCSSRLNSFLKLMMYYIIHVFPTFITKDSWIGDITIPFDDKVQLTIALVHSYFLDFLDHDLLYYSTKVREKPFFQSRLVGVFYSVCFWFLTCYWVKLCWARILEKPGWGMDRWFPLIRKSILAEVCRVLRDCNCHN